MGYKYNPFSGKLDDVGAGGTPGGANTQVQFNDNGAFAGNSGLSYNSTNAALNIGSKLRVGDTTAPGNTMEMYDGKFNVVSITAPTALSASATTGSALSAGSYYYKVTFTTAAGETEGGAVSTSLNISSGASMKASLSSIPTGPSNVTARKIYRTIANGSSYYWTTQLNNNTTTTTTDGRTDASLTAQSALLNYDSTSGWFMKNGNNILGLFIDTILSDARVAMPLDGEIGAGKLFGSPSSGGSGYLQLWSGLTGYMTIAETGTAYGIKIFVGDPDADTPEITIKNNVVGINTASPDSTYALDVTGAISSTTYVKGGSYIQTGTNFQWDANTYLSKSGNDIKFTTSSGSVDVNTMRVINVGDPTADDDATPMNRFRAFSTDGSTVTANVDITVTFTDIGTANYQTYAYLRSSGGTVKGYATVIKSEASNSITLQFGVNGAAYDTIRVIIIRNWNP